MVGWINKANYEIMARLEAFIEVCEAACSKGTIIEDSALIAIWQKKKLSHEIMG